MRHLAPVTLALAFGLGLAYFISERMSNDTMAVIIGVAVGVASSVPTTILLLALLRRGRVGFSAPAPPAPTQAPQMPPIVMLDPLALSRQYGFDLARHPEPPPNLLADGGQRTLRVVGEEWRE